MVMWVALGLAALAVILVGPVPPWLAGASWPQRAPRAAVVLWQAIGLTAALSAVGAGLGVAVAPLATTVTHGVHTLLAQLLMGEVPTGFHLPQWLALLWAIGFTGFLAWRCSTAIARTLRRRRQHLNIVEVVAERATELGEDVDLIRYDAPTAYCLPGRPSRIVISTGALRILEAREVRAVLAHERAHARARHDLAVLPFAALAYAMPQVAAARHARSAVGLLLEMLADDRARQDHGAKVLTRALARFAANQAPVPPGALAAGGDAVLIRIRRLLAGSPTIPVWRRALVYLVAFLLLLTPALVALSPAVSALS